MKMRFPDFVIIGAAKSGTTTLYQYLCRHPQVYMSTPKEPEFFARDEVYSLGSEWYASLFEQAKPDQICGEASTKYTNSDYPKSAERLAQLVSNPKLIYVMRNPTERAYSHYVQRIKTGQNTRTQLEITRTFEEAIAQEDFLLKSGIYIEQIENYLRFFPKESFLFLLMEDLIESPQDVLRQTCSFLGIDQEIDLTEEGLIYANQASTHKKWFLRSRITAPLKSISVVNKIAESLPKKYRDLAYTFLKNLPYAKTVQDQYLPKPMLPETREILIDKFREPNQRLANFLNRNLSHWDS